MRTEALADDASMTERKKAAERYAEAIKELRKVLGDSAAFAFAAPWALVECRKAKRHDWSVNNQFIKTWAGASAAARKLADHLTASDLAIGRVGQAARQIGVTLRFESKELDAVIKAAKTPRRAENERAKATAAMFPKLLRALSEQPVPRPRRTFDGGTRFYYGPFMFAANQRRKPPYRATTLALALAYGFRAISECAEDQRPFEDLFMSFRPNRGNPCYAAAVEFANATFDNDKKQTNVSAVQQYLNHNRPRYIGFDD
jgi:hypothetical protein